MPYCYIYIRASKYDQVEHGHTMPMQERQALEYFERVIKPRFPDVELGIIFIEEGVSAYKIPIQARPKGRLLNEALQPGDHAVFVYFDRSFRSSKDYHNTSDEWHRRGVKMHFLDMQVDTSTPEGEMLMSIKAAVSRMESRIISRRCKNVQQYLKSVGKPYGGRIPMGMKSIGKQGKRKWVPDYKMRAIMQEVVRMKDDHGMTWNEIAKEINRRLKCYTGNAPNHWYKPQWTYNYSKKAYYREKELEAQELARREEKLRLARIKGTADTPIPRIQDSAPSEPPADSDGSADHQAVA